MAFSGVLPGRTLEWFVPTLFKGRWLARGGRLLREIPDDYQDDRPVPMSQARKKLSTSCPEAESKTATVIETPVDTGQDEEKPKVKRGVRKGA